MGRQACHVRLVPERHICGDTRTFQLRRQRHHPSPSPGLTCSWLSNSWKDDITVDSTGPKAAEGESASRPFEAIFGLGAGPHISLKLSMQNHAQTYYSWAYIIVLVNLLRSSASPHTIKSKMLRPSVISCASPNKMGCATTAKTAT